MTLTMPADLLHYWPNWLVRERVWLYVGECAVKKGSSSQVRLLSVLKINFRMVQEDLPTDAMRNRTTIFRGPPESHDSGEDYLAQGGGEEIAESWKEDNSKTLGNR